MPIDFNFSKDETEYKVSFELTQSKKDISIGGRNYKVIGDEKAVSLLLHQIEKLQISDFENIDSFKASLLDSSDKFTLIFHKTIESSPPGERSVLDAQRSFKKRLEQKEPLSESEILEFYSAIFEKDEGQIPPNWQEDDCLSLLHDLHELVTTAKEHPESMIKPVHGLGVNGVYFLTFDGEKRWVFKPKSEEASVFKGILPGEGAKREHVCYLLNPATTPYVAYVNLFGRVGSVQKFVKASSTIMSPSFSIGMNLDTRENTMLIDTSANRDELFAKLSKKDLQTSLAFDVRFNNLDRHRGNLLVQPDGRVWTIDQGACMSRNPIDPPRYEQLETPQMFEDWEDSLKAEILTLDEVQIRYAEEIMRKHEMPEEAITRMRVATRVLVHAMEISEESKRKDGPIISPYDVGLLFLKEHTKFWDPENEQVLKDFFSDVLQEKEKIHALTGNVKIGIAKAQRAYRRVAKSPDFAYLLYGESERNFGFNESILGKVKI